VHRPVTGTLLDLVIHVHSRQAAGKLSAVLGEQIQQDVGIDAAAECHPVVRRQGQLFENKLSAQPTFRRTHRKTKAADSALRSADPAENDSADLAGRSLST
jgi:hypothetical protein